MSTAAPYVSAREALELFMAGHEPPLDDTRMGDLVSTTRTGITKIRNGDRNPSLPLATKLEAVTGIPASAWEPATPAQGQVSPSWLKIPPKAAPKRARKPVAAAA